MKRIVIANQSMDMGEAIEALLEDMFGDQDVLLFTHARNSVKVQAALNVEAHQMLVTELDLAEDKASSVLRLGGLRLAGQVRGLYPGLPLVIIAPYTTPEISENVAALGNAALVLQGQDFEDELKAQVGKGLDIGEEAQRKLSGDPREPKPTDIAVRVAEPVRFLVEIRLREGGDCDYRSKSIGGLVPFVSDLRFTVKREDLQELVTLTARLVDSKTWARDYEALGNRLRDVLLEGDIQVIKNLARLSERMQTAQPGSQPAICFVVEKGLYPIALEALRDGDDRTGYWFEKAPVWRRLAINGSRRFPLFQDEETREGPINCLVVEADASGMVSDLNVQVGPIPGVLEEARELIDYLGKQTTVCIGKIGRIWCEGGNVYKSVSVSGEVPTEGEICKGSFRQAMSDMLTTGEPWHLVHHAGHSHYDAVNDYGYVLLPGESRDVVHELDYVGATEFAKWLSRTRFVYMSSCLGSSQDFVFNLCMHGVPALAGFRWNIDDEMAKRHSQTFYEELFQRRSMEEALFWTWNRMFGRHRANRVWASSQLVMQYSV